MPTLAVPCSVMEKAAPEVTAGESPVREILPAASPQSCGKAESNPMKRTKKRATPRTRYAFHIDLEESFVTIGEPKNALYFSSEPVFVPTLAKKDFISTVPANIHRLDSAASQEKPRYVMGSTHT